MELILTGFHAIEESVKKAKRELPQAEFKLLYSEPIGPRVKKILALSNSKKLTALKVSQAELDHIVEKLPPLLKNHRGVVLVYSTANTITTLESFLAENSNKEKLTLSILCNIIDPHNVGAILRSAEQFGVNALITTEHKTAGDFATIAKVSSGANNFVPIITVKNLSRASEVLKNAGFWLYGADLNGENLREVKFAKRSCVVLGSEGAGINLALKNKMDKIITIPTSGKIDSLNVSNAAAIIFYEIAKSN